MSESTGGRPSTEYELTIDMAKQICMIQRTPEGKFPIFYKMLSFSLLLYIQKWQVLTGFGFLL